MLAGFEQPTDGQILIDGVDVAQTPAHKRPVNTVFQSYALFPHLDVEHNVAYGLRWRKDLAKRDRAAKVAKALDLVQLSGYGKRRPQPAVRRAAAARGPGHGRWSSSRRCCSSTSRSVPSTRSSGTRCALS